MRKNLRYLICAAVIPALGFVSNAYADTTYAKQKVVYHINYDNPKAQAGALRNIQNHINAVGAENLDLKVVLHGNGPVLLLEPSSIDNVKNFPNYHLS